MKNWLRKALIRLASNLSWLFYEVARVLAKLAFDLSRKGGWR